MIINLLCDNKNSWFWNYSENFKKELENKKHKVNICTSENDLASADISVFISCINIVTSKGLRKSNSNIVCHPSDLPNGKGHSPIAWEILKGVNELTFTLFEAVEGVDSGPIYDKVKVGLSGHELNSEIKKIQAETTFKMIGKYIDLYPSVDSSQQEGKETFYKKRTPQDCQLDINKSIVEQFNLLRTVDNNLYPAFFLYKNHKYILKIEKSN